MFFILGDYIGKKRMCCNIMRANDKIGGNGSANVCYFRKMSAISEIGVLLPERIGMFSSVNEI